MIRITATISLWSKLIEGTQISAMLGIEADTTTRKGIERTPPRARPDAYGWHLSQSLSDADPRVEEVLRPLAEMLTAFPALLATVRAKDPELRVKISIAIVPAASDEELPADYKISMFIDREIIEILAALEADFDFEVYTFRS